MFSESTMQRLRFIPILIAVAYLVTGCTTSSNSFLEEFELPILGEGKEGEELVMPPRLVAPKTKDNYIIPGSKMSMRKVAMSSSVLPERMDMRLYRDGDVAWLLVGLSPVDVWGHVKTFFEGYGFIIIGENLKAGVMETSWLERTANNLGGISLRDKFRVRLERDANSLTNVYVVNRRSQYHDGEWQLAFSDIETELDVLYDLREYLSQLQAGNNSKKLAELEDLTRPLDIADVEGVPVLTIGSSYSDVWRNLGVALERSGAEVRDSDRSRGIYLVRYNNGIDTDFNDADSDAEFIQLHLLARGNETLVTAHRDRAGRRGLSYATAHQLLKKIVWVY